MQWTSGDCCPQYKGPSLNITSRSRHLALQGFRDASGSLFRCADRPSKARGLACQAKKAEQDEKACSFKWLPWISMGCGQNCVLGNQSFCPVHLLGHCPRSLSISPGGPQPLTPAANRPIHLTITRLAGACVKSPDSVLTIACFAFSDTSFEAGEYQE